MAEIEGSTLVNNTWNNSKDKSLAVADVYTAPTESVISAAPEVANAAASKTKSMLKTTASALRTAAKAVKTVNELKKAVTNGDVFARITAGAPALTKALAAVGITTPASLAKYVDGAASMSVRVGTVYRDIKATDFANADAAGALLAKYTGDNAVYKIADQGATAAFALGVVNACVSNGIPNSVSKVVGVLGEDAPLNTILGGSLPIAISKSDYECIGEIADAAGTNLKLFSPTVAEDFTSAFNKPLFWGDGSYQKMTSALSSADPLWNIGSINMSPTVNLTNVINSSDDFKSIIATEALTTPDANGKVTTEQAMLVFGTAFTKTNVETELKQSFPLTLYSTSTVQKTDVINPLLVGSI